MAPRNKPNEIQLTRVYDAPVSLVWEAWTDPEQTAQWWGPRGFTLTTHSKDLRVGGTWNYTMHGPDGTDYRNITQYLEVEPQSRLVYDHGGNETQPPLFRVTVTFVEENGKTTMDMTMAMPSPEAAVETGKFIKKAGGNATWDRLGEYLEKKESDKDIFVINRSFRTPTDLLFDAWTDPQHFARWLPPTGFTMKFIKANIREGGEAFYCMTSVEDKNINMYGKTKYVEIQRPNRIVYIQEFSDAEGNISRHPMMPTWPERILTKVTLTAEGPEQTRVTVVWEPFGKITAEELSTFIQIKGEITQGWTGSFDKLEDYLKR